MHVCVQAIAKLPIEGVAPAFGQSEPAMSAIIAGFPGVSNFTTCISVATSCARHIATDAPCYQVQSVTRLLMSMHAFYTCGVNVSLPTGASSRA